MVVGILVIMYDIVTVFTSLIIEATPFLILGTLIATAVQRYNFFDWVLAHLPTNTFARRVTISLFGIALPVCECGNVPLARSLMRKGLTIPEATTFLLAAPIINPITFITTKEAFRGVPWMLPARLISGFVIALIIGQLVGNFKQRKMITEDFETSCTAKKIPLHKKQFFSLQFADEFWSMFKLLAIGAAIASITQFVFHNNLLSRVNDNLIVGVGIMLIFGFVISICSNVDAFFVLGYVGTFKYGALLTFLVAGPMVDIKTIAMLRNTYTKHALYLIVAGVAVLASIIGIGFSYVG